MGLCSTLRVSSAASLAVVLLLGNPSFGQSSRSKEKSGSAKTSRRQERAAGVIIKVEPVVKGAAPGSTIEKEPKAGKARATTHRLTINMDVVWRDWSRDQAKSTDTGPAKADAEKGANSVATLGEPVDRNNLVVVDVGPETKVETRFRSPGDETNRGSKTPAAARGEKAKDSDASSARPVRFRAEDLKPGLFVEVDYRHATARNPASTVTVIRPIGGPNAPARSGAAAAK